MISFRFHVVSITAVFLAIAIGIVVGSTYVDELTVDQLRSRIETVEDRTRSFSDVEKRVQTLIDTATQAQQAAEKLLGPDSDLQKHRRQVQQRSSLRRLQWQPRAVRLRQTRSSVSTCRRCVRRRPRSRRTSWSAAGLRRRCHR